MAGLKCDWNLAELDLQADNPFDTVILTSGLSIDLTGDEQAIHEGLRATLLVESQLYNRGITCPLKDAGQDCLTCAVYTADLNEPRAPLCRLGRDQRGLEVRAVELRDAPYLALAREHRRYAELAAA